jgi:hypothetical protein
MISFSSRFYIGSVFLYSISFVTIILDIVVIRFNIIPVDSSTNYYIISLYCILIMLSLFFVLFEKQRINQIDNLIEELSIVKYKTKDKFLSNFVTKLIKHYSIFSNNSSLSYAFFSRTIEDLGSFRNSPNIITSAILIYASEFHFISDNPALGFIYALLTSILILILIRIVYWEIKHNESRRIKTFLGAIILIIIICSTFKSSLINNYGRKEIGAWFERPFYSTYYNVEILNEEDGTYNINSTASIKVLNEDEEIYSEEDSYGVSHMKFEYNRVVIIDSIEISSSNWVKFDNCKISINETTDCNCKDSNGVSWYINIKDKTKL